MSEPIPPFETRAGDDLLAELADDFLRHHRAGERPSVDEYAKKHPNLADRIRDLFPAMMAMEQSSHGATLDAALPAGRIGATIGRYKLLELHRRERVCSGISHAGIVADAAPGSIIGRRSGGSEAGDRL